MKIYSIHIATQKTLVLHFGIGLIGTSIYQSIHAYFERQQDFQSFDIPFKWKSDFLPQFIMQLQERTNDFIKNIDKFIIIWSAGKAGFGAKQAEIEREFDFFKKAVVALEDFLSLHFSEKVDFYLLSSAGGLFEGQTDINQNSVPHPMRPYGILKLQQEKFLVEHTRFYKKIILRPSSVYSLSNIQARLGLIPTLVKNGIKNQITYLFGSEDTIRDYILDEEIGDFVVKNIMWRRDKQQEFQRETYVFLISSKPTSIYEIKSIIENTLGMKLYVQYSLNKTNSKDMSFSATLKPPLLKVSSLQTNVKRLYLNILNYRYESNLL